MEKKQLIVLLLLSTLIASSLLSYGAMLVVQPQIQVKVTVSICGELHALPNFTTPFARAYGDLLVLDRGTSLGDFFNYEGMKFNSNCIYGYCNGENRCPDPEPDLVKMWVNGFENFEFERYVPRHGDEIVIDYSSGRPEPGLEGIRIVPR